MTCITLIDVLKGQEVEVSGTEIRGVILSEDVAPDHTVVVRVDIAGRPVERIVDVDSLEPIWSAPASYVDVA